MTVDHVAIEDEMTVVRLNWLEAEAQLVELLPSTTPTPTGSGALYPKELAAALEQAERTHHAYMTTIRRWVGLSAN